MVTTSPVPHHHVFANLLSEHRAQIIDRWLAAASAQPFHQGRPADEVMDHVPVVLDALIKLMRSASPNAGLGLTPEDESVLGEATTHASRRFEQGLHPDDVVTEFRLLRQEIGRAIWEHLPDDLPARTAGLAELFVQDALDGATKLSLSALVRQIEEVREEILATTMHEVRQPITSIRASIQLAKRHLTAGATNLAGAVESLARAEVATDQMMMILNRLDAVSRLALSRLEIHTEPADLAQIVNDARGRLDADEARRISLEIAPGTDTTGEWDPEALGQVVANLLSNALKYSPTATPIELRIVGDDEQVTLSVSDHGIGLGPQEAEELFHRYARASGAVEEGIPGIGLGLFLARGIVRAHRGTIRAQSAGRGQGTTFVVMIPRAVPAEATSTPPSAL
jgi:signal transduction histidine kinase